MLLLSNLFGNINWLSAERLLTITKIAAIISLMGATSYITWNIAQREMDKERLQISQAQMQAEKLITQRWFEQVNKVQENSLKIAEANRTIDLRVDAVLKENKNAPALPSDCIMDDFGVRLLRQAREAALSTTSTTSNSK